MSGRTKRYNGRGFRALEVGESRWRVNDDVNGDKGIPIALAVPMALYV